MSLDPYELGYMHIVKGLSRSEVLGFLDAAVVIQVPEETVVSYQGEVDPTMIFVLEGALEEGEDDGTITSPLRRWNRGEHLGEQAVLGIQPRRATTLRTLIDSTLLVLDEAGLSRLRAAGHPVADRIEVAALRQLTTRLREIDTRISRMAVGAEIELGPGGAVSRFLRSLGAGKPHGRPPEPMEVLQRSPFFARLTHELREKLASELEAVPFARGETVVAEGEHEGDAWIVASGQVGVYRQTAHGRHERLGELGGGTLFGHLSIIDGDARTATCVAEGPAWMLRVPRELVEVLVDNATPEGRALRLCLMDALARQLDQAESTLARVEQEWRSHRGPELYTPDDLAAARRQDGEG